MVGLTVFWDGLIDDGVEYQIYLLLAVANPSLRRHSFPPGACHSNLLPTSNSGMFLIPSV